MGSTSTVRYSIYMYMISANLEKKWADSHEGLFDIEKLLKTVVLEK